MTRLEVDVGRVDERMDVVQLLATMENAVRPCETPLPKHGVTIT